MGVEARNARIVPVERSTRTYEATGAHQSDGGSQGREFVWFLDSAHSRSSEPRALAAELSVFERPSREIDRLPVSYEAGDEAKLAEDENGPRELRHLSRALLSGLGPRQSFSVYGIPTTDGSVCLHVIHDRGAFEVAYHCERGLIEMGLLWSMIGARSWFVTYGLIGDDVRNVRIVFENGTDRQAILYENAFVMEVHGAEACARDVEAFIVEFTNGDQRRVERESPLGMPGTGCESEEG